MTDLIALAQAKRWMGGLPRHQFEMMLAIVLDARRSERAEAYHAGHAVGQSEAEARVAELVAALRECVEALALFASDESDKGWMAIGAIQTARAALGEQP